MLADCFIVLSALVACCQAGDRYCRLYPRARGCTAFPILAAELYREGESTVSEFKPFVTLKPTARSSLPEAVVLPTATLQSGCPVLTTTAVPGCCITTATPCAFTTVPIITPVASTAVVTSTAVASVSQEAGNLEGDTDEYPDDVTSMTKKTMSGAAINSFASSAFGAAVGLLFAVLL